MKGKLMPWVAVDFDHTIVNGDKILPGAKEGLALLREMGYSVMIHSCNNKGWIERVLQENDIRYDYIWNPSEDKGKPVCVAYIDDRGVGFTGNWQVAVQDVVNIEKRRERIYQNVDASAETGTE
jgi:hydroxymethylpyrimidine pyrophosphatase-like HAD family hydrolase